MWRFAHMVHLGEKIHQSFKNSGFSVVEFARRINTSRENVYAIFKRASIDAMMLSRISDVLDYNFFLLITPEKFKRYDNLETREERLRFKEKELSYQEEIKRLTEMLKKQE